MPSCSTPFCASVFTFLGGLKPLLKAQLLLYAPEPNRMTMEKSFFPLKFA